MRLSGIIGSFSVCLMFCAVGDLEAQANELGSSYFGQKGLGDFVKIWDSASGSGVSGNPGGASDNIQTIPEGWNEWTDVNLANQIYYYVNYNWTDNADRFLAVTAKLYEDDVIGNDLVGIRSVELYAQGMGSYTSGLDYYIGPNGWIAKLEDGTVVGESNTQVIGFDPPASAGELQPVEVRS
jgi:hypothetical protein